MHARGCEPLQVVELFSDALAAEAVQAPEQHYVEAPLVGIEKELLALRSLSTTSAFLVAVLFIDCVS